MNAGKRREILLSGGEGRNPHAIALEEYWEAGFEPVGSTKAIRQKCLDCSGAFTEVKLCPAVECPLWSWRLGTRPKAWKGLQKCGKRDIDAVPEYGSTNEGGGQG